MRKLKLQVQMSVDGFIAGPQGEMDFMAWNWDDALKQYVEDLTESVDGIVMGRKLAEGFIPYWAQVASDPQHEEFEAGKTFAGMPKVVFSRTLKESPWENARIAQRELTAEIRALKEQPGEDIIAYGGAEFVSSLIQEGLVDDFHLFVNPVAIGQGMPIFQALDRKQGFTLREARSFTCGIVVLHYGRRDGA